MKDPAYVIELVSEDAVAEYKGYAYLEDEPWLAGGKVAQFDGVWTKTAATERCAAEVLDLLQGVERKIEWEEWAEGKRKRTWVDVGGLERLRKRRAVE